MSKSNMSYTTKLFILMIMTLVTLGKEHYIVDDIIKPD